MLPSTVNGVTNSTEIFPISNYRFQSEVEQTELELAVDTYQNRSGYTRLAVVTNRIIQTRK
jgi:hypothetical protein